MNLRFIILILLVSLFKPNCYCQQSVFEFPKNGIFTSVLIDKDSAAVISVMDNSDAVNLIKIDANGNIVWSRNYLIEGKVFKINSVTSWQGNLVLSGFLILSQMEIQPAFLEVNSCLEVTKVVKYTGAEPFSRLEKVETLPGGAYLGHFSYLKSNYSHIAKLDSTGFPIWFNTIDADFGKSYYHNESFYFIGNCYRPETPGSDELLNKSVYNEIDKDGKLKFEEVIGLTDSNSVTNGIALVQISEGSIIQAINCRTPNQALPIIFNSVMLLKKHKNMTVAAKIVSDTFYDEGPVELIKISANRYLLTSSYYSDTLTDTTTSKCYLIDSNLNVISSRILPAPGMLEMSLTAIAQLPSNNYILVGYRIKGGASKPIAYILDSALNIVAVPGINKSYNTWCNYLATDSTVDTTPDLVVDLSSYEFPLKTLNPIQTSRIHIYPNPGDGSIQVSAGNIGPLMVKVFDNQGRLIIQSKSSTSKFELDLREFPNGIFFIQSTNTKGEIIFSEKYLKVD